MEKISIKTENKKQILDITDLIEEKIRKIAKGICFLFLTHTSAALTTADLDPGTDLDMLDVFEKLIPKLTFRHPHDPKHTPDHILSSLIGTSINLPVENNKLILGIWQRVVLVEFDGPREREIILSIISTTF